MKPFKEGRIDPEVVRKAIAKGAFHKSSSQIERTFKQFVGRQIRSLESDYDLEDDWIWRDPDEGDR